MESKSLVVDSNVFIAFYNSNDTQHIIALRLMEELQSATLIIHPYVIQEVSTVLTYQFGFAAAKKFLSDITTANNIVIPSINIQSEIHSFCAIGKKMSFTDIALINLAEQMSVQLLTFDKQILSILKRIGNS